MKITIMILITIVATMAKADIKLTDEGCQMLFDKISKYHDKHQEAFINKKASELDKKIKKDFKTMKSFYNKNCIYREKMTTSYKGR